LQTLTALSPILRSFRYHAGVERCVLNVAQAAANRRFNFDGTLTRMAMEKKKSRGLFRFTLRTLLLVFLGGSAVVAFIVARESQHARSMQWVNQQPGIGVYGAANEAWYWVPNWVRQRCGKFAFRTCTDLSLTGDSHPTSLLSSGALTKLLPEVKSVRIVRCKLDDELMKSLQHLSAVEELRLDRASWASKSAIPFPPLPRLRTLSVLQSDVCDAAFPDLNQSNQLKLLTLLQTHCGDSMVAAACRSPVLQQATLAEIPLSSIGVDALQRCEQLEALSVYHTGLNDEELRRLANAPKLGDFSFNHRSAGSAMLPIEDLQKLFQLELFGPEETIPDGYFTSASELKNLEQLRATSVAPTEQRLVGVSQGPSLKRVYFANKEVSLEGLATIGRLPCGMMLWLLDSEPTPITTYRDTIQLTYREPGTVLPAATLSDIGRGNWKAVAGTLFKSVRFARESDRFRLGNEKILQWFGDRCTPSDLPVLAENDQFEQVFISNAVVSKELLATIAKFPQLKEIRFSLCQFEEGSLAALSIAKPLERLVFMYGSLQANELQEIATITQLQQLVMRRIEVRPNALKSLSSLTELEELTMIHCQMGDQGWEEAPKLPKLQLLVAFESDLADPFFHWACQQPAIDRLIICKANITASAFGSFRPTVFPCCLTCVETPFDDQSLIAVCKNIGGNEATIDCRRTAVTLQGLQQVEVSPKLSMMVDNGLAKNASWAAVEKRFANLEAHPLSSNSLLFYVAKMMIDMDRQGSYVLAPAIRAPIETWSQSPLPHGHHWASYPFDEGVVSAPQPIQPDRLRVVYLRGEDVSKPLVKELAGCPWLAEVSIDGPVKDSQGFEELRSIPRLRSLILNRSPIDAAVAEKIVQLPLLSLTLNDSPCDPQAAKTLDRLPVLTRRSGFEPIVDESE
jgi:hypothetical protein